MSDEDLRQAWERSKPIEADRTRRSPTSVLSIRLPDSVMEGLAERARSEGKPASTLARELLESALVSDVPDTPIALAGLFRRWVGEALSPMATPTVDRVFASPTISNLLWVSYEKNLLRSDNYDFPKTEHRIFGFEDPVLTSRTRDTETDPAGENAA